MKKNMTLILLLFVVTVSCDNQKGQQDILNGFTEYLAASKADSKTKWNYTSDTIKVWFDEKKGNPSKRIKGEGSSGKWKEWDEQMHSKSYYDSLWYDKSEHAVKGFFYENNDFYDLIGKSPTKTLRTYWLNSENKIYEILYYWIPDENTTTSHHLKPIVEWALKNDSSEILELYPNGRIIPSKENAIRWKKLLTKYNETINRN
jgi:hypothetical protein